MSYSAPAVRTEPEPPAPPAIPYEKWTRWNSFDPDSDEFFEREDAVYEAFVDSPDIAPVGARIMDPPMGPLMLMGRGRSESPTSSEGTISGRGSPMAVGSDDSENSLGYIYRSRINESRLTAGGEASYEAFVDSSDIAPVRERTTGPPMGPQILMGRERSESPTSSEGTISGGPMAVGSDDSSSMLAIYRARVYEARLFAGGETGINPADVTADMNAPPIPNFRDIPATYDQTPQAHVSHVVYTSNGSTQSDHVRVSITPVSDSNAGFIPPSAPTTFYYRPTTPSPNYDSAQEQASPSPAPIVTPRLYAWSSHSPFPPHSPTPSIHQRRTGPLTNPNARMSLAHLSSASVRVRTT
jgi:hypothetical protein